MDSLIRLLSQWIQISLSQWWFLLPFGKTRPQIKSNDPPQKINAPVIVNRKIINTVMSSFQESESGPCFINGKYSATLHNALYKMNHIQGTTPIQFHNIVANGIITETVIQRRSKAMDMRFYWLCDQCLQKQFHVHWKQGQQNIEDYPSKHHYTQNDISVRPTYALNTIKSKQKLYLN